MVVEPPRRRAIWWVKRDMRVTDKEALCRAVAECDEVLALFVCEPSLYNAEETSAMHVFAWWQAAKSLRKNLATLGAELYIGSGEVTEVLAHIKQFAPFDILYSHEETGSAITYRRDQSVAQWVQTNGIRWCEIPQNGVVRGLADRDERSALIRNRLFETLPFAAPTAVKGWTLPEAAVTLHLPEHHSTGGVTVSKRFPDYASLCAIAPDARINKSALQVVTEEAALETMQSFLSARGREYSGGISSPNSAFRAGSRLSVHLAWGTISIRNAFYLSNQRLDEIQQYGGPDSFQWSKSLRAFQSRLHWHDHFIQRLESAPSMEHTALNLAYDEVEYENDPVLLQAWLNGETGLPLIDACMRCLQECGFCNFRMRSMLVTTACFGLSQSWRVLQYPLARIFYDYEPGIHFSQIQMQASIVGINTMRVYSPHKQLLDQDPECKFVKQWVPELRDFDTESIGQYNEIALGDYPAPVTDIQTNAKAMKTQLTTIRKSPEGSAESERVLLEHGSRLRRGRRSRKASKKKTAQMKLDW